MVVMQEEESIRIIYDGSSDGGNREAAYIWIILCVYIVGWSMTISGLTGKERQTVANGAYDFRFIIYVRKSPNRR
uniref:Uncharacterized protein n=1 Tax=Glossina palpalis gambiensis TaxID=67801 RepID=A0A1B0B3S3_9MUSC